MTGWSRRPSRKRTSIGRRAVDALLHALRHLQLAKRVPIQAATSGALNFGLNPTRPSPDGVEFRPRSGLPFRRRRGGPAASRDNVVVYGERDPSGLAFPELRIENEVAVGPAPQRPAVVLELMNPVAEPRIV